MEPALIHGSRPTYVDELAELLRILVVAGVAVGIVVIGFGSRLAMYALRLTSPDEVVGLVSDDGFVIGRVTLSGTYNLLVVGAVVGVIGAAACVAVAPWLIGPTWFRRLSVGLTAGALVGSMLIHADGVDFTALGPLWFAVALFIALPAVSGVALAIAVDRVAAPGSWAARGSRRWAVPLALLILVSPSLVIIVPVAIVVAVLLPLRRLLLEPLSESRIGTLAIRGAFLTIPVLAALSLAGDLAELF